jgi:hypothetical protein
MTNTTQQNDLEDIKGMLENARGDLSPADLIEFISEIHSLTRKFQEEAQEKIVAEMEGIASGGFDSIRSLDELEDIQAANSRF